MRPCNLWVICLVGTKGPRRSSALVFKVLEGLKNEVVALFAEFPKLGPWVRSIRRSLVPILPTNGVRISRLGASQRELHNTFSKQFRVILMLQWVALTLCEVKLLEMAADFTKFIKLEDSRAFDQQPKMQTANQCFRSRCITSHPPQCFP